MNDKIHFNILPPSEANLSKPAPVVRRCNTCIFHGECPRIESNGNAIQRFYERIIENDCEYHRHAITIVRNDERELENLKKYMDTKV